MSWYPFCGCVEGKPKGETSFSGYLDTHPESSSFVTQAFYFLFLFLLGLSSSFFSSGGGGDGVRLGFWCPFTTHPKRVPSKKKRDAYVLLGRIPMDLRESSSRAVACDGLRNAAAVFGGTPGNAALNNFFRAWSPEKKPLASTGHFCCVCFGGWIGLVIHRTMLLETMVPLMANHFLDPVMLTQE